MNATSSFWKSHSSNGIRPPDTLSSIFSDSTKLISSGSRMPRAMRSSSSSVRLATQALAHRLASAGIIECAVLEDSVAISSMFLRRVAGSSWGV